MGHGAILHGCKIGDACLIGMGAIIMDDAAIGRGYLIAVGSVVISGIRFRPVSVVDRNLATVRRKVAENEARSFIRWARKYRGYTKEYLK